MLQNTDGVFAANEYPVELPDMPMWQENYAFTCTDPVTGIGLLAFLGRSSADPGLWREVVAIALPGERMLCMKNYGRAATAEVASASLFRVEVVRPAQTVRIVYDGPAFEQPRADLLKYGFQPGLALRCKFELVLDGVAPVWNVSGNVGNINETAGLAHTEQVGRGDGYIEFGTERFDLRNASTSRAHRSGPRNIDNFKRHCWANGYFQDDDITFGMNAVEVYGVDGAAVSHASVTKAGRRHPAEVKEIELIEGYADGCRPFKMVIASELGEMVLNKSATITSTPISMVSPWDVYIGAIHGVPSGLTFAEAVRWEWQGKQGTGWSERCFVHEPFSRFSAPMPKT